MLAVLDSAHCLDVLVVPTSTPPLAQTCRHAAAPCADLLLYPRTRDPPGMPTVLAATSHQGILLH